MLRLYDFRHEACGTERDATVEVPHGTKPKRTYRLDCRACGRKASHLRILSPPAKYLGEKPRSPRIHGGTYDTMGFEQNKHPEPPMPNSTDPQAFVEHFRSPEYRAFNREEQAVRKRNKPKRARAKAGVSFRHNPLPGDPKL